LVIEPTAFAFCTSLSSIIIPPSLRAVLHEYEDRLEMTVTEFRSPETADND
jgi:hypothetical protein